MYIIWTPYPGCLASCFKNRLCRSETAAGLENNAQQHIAHPLAHKAACQIPHLSMQVLQILRGPPAVTTRWETRALKGHNIIF